jgi:uncharacterized protein (DUF302 family)
MKALSIFLLSLVMAVPALAQQPEPAPNPYMVPFPVPLPLPLPTFSLPTLPFPFSVPMAPQQSAPHRPYEMHGTISEQQRKRMIQMAMPFMTNLMHMTMPEAMNYFALKYKAKPGLSFDDVVQSMLLRANQLNFKQVGVNQMWKDFKAVLNDDTAPKIEVYSFCDIGVGRDLLKISPEMIVFLPCRIAVMEDADKNIWVLSIDWDVTWMEGFKDQMGMTNDLWKGAVDIRDKMDNIMHAAANGDL